MMAEPDSSRSEVDEQLSFVRSQEAKTHQSRRRAGWVLVVYVTAALTVIIIKTSVDDHNIVKNQHEIEMCLSQHDEQNCRFR